jgi:hypothetical protein
VKPPKFDTIDIHVHVPEGATPKDGPSAGVAMVTSIVSVLTGIPVRKDIAMTGEVTLRGNVLQIGGLKEKLLAALRGGIKTVLIPEDNAKDLPEIPDNVKEGLTIIPVGERPRGAEACAGARARADRMGRGRRGQPPRCVSGKARFRSIRGLRPVDILIGTAPPGSLWITSGRIDSPSAPVIVAACRSAG